LHSLWQSLATAALRQSDLQLCALLIDGTPFKGREMIVALGITNDGRKTVLGHREGATENIAVVSELVSDLAARGLDFSVPRLYVLDGGKALAAAMRRHAGEATVIQRCQEHKRRNGKMPLRKRGHVSLAYIQGEARGQHALFPSTLDELIPADYVCRVH
jgi:transposase-like protein